MSDLPLNSVRAVANNTIGDYISNYGIDSDTCEVAALNTIIAHMNLENDTLKRENNILKLKNDILSEVSESVYIVRCFHPFSIFANTHIFSQLNTAKKYIKKIIIRYNSKMQAEYITQLHIDDFNLKLDNMPTTGGALTGHGTFVRETTFASEVLLARGCAFTNGCTFKNGCVNKHNGCGWDSDCKNKRQILCVEKKCVNE